MTDYIAMLGSVPDHRRQYMSLTIDNEIEGEDCVRWIFMSSCLVVNNIDLSNYHDGNDYNNDDNNNHYFHHYYLLLQNRGFH